MADNRILAAIARKGGARLLDAAVEKILPAEDAAPAEKPRPTLLAKAAGAVALRVATRSVPGAIVVGGAMLAKRLYDKRHAGKGAKGKAKPEA